MPHSKEKDQIKKGTLDYKSSERTNNFENELKRKAIITKLKVDWDIYKKVRNETNNQLIEAKKYYYCIKISAERQRSKAAWKTSNCLLGKLNKPTNVNKLIVNNSKLASPEENSEGCNNFF